MRPIVIAAGGTGGHFFPAEAVAAALIERGHRVVLLTDSRSGATSSSVFAGREIYILKGAGLAGRGLARGAAALAAMAAGCLQARAIMHRLRPVALVAFGGYPSVAPVLAARTLAKRPAVVLQEQNAVLGRANRFLARYADLLALGFDNTLKMPANVRTIVTGNPVRPALRALYGARYHAPGEHIRLLVLGGSLGARVFSDVVPAAVANLPASMQRGLIVTQQCRSEDLGRVRAAYAAADIQVSLAPFFDDVAGLLAQSHLVVARAGASTCAELAISGRPAILVPLPGAIDGHQEANAERLSSSGATLCRQPDFTVAWLSQALTEAIGEPGYLADCAASIAQLGRPGAASDLAEAVERLAIRAEVLP